MVAAFLVRDTSFRLAGHGYKTEGVDGLLRRVAAELDQGGSPASIIESAILPTATGFSRGYDRDSVDIFFGQFLESQPERGGSVSAGGALETTWQLDPTGNWFDRNRSFSDDCAERWAGFEQLSGPRLRFIRVKGNRQLRDQADRVLVTVRPRRFSADGGTVSRFTKTASVGEVSFRRHSVKANPDLALRAWEARYGTFSPQANGLRQSRNFAADGGQWRPKVGRRRLKPPSCVEWVDGLTDQVTLCQLGSNFDQRAAGMIGFSDGQCWRFPVRGSSDRAIMTAVDLGGSAHVRYRVGKYPGQRRTWNGLSHPTVEIAVVSHFHLRPDRLLAIALSAPWLTGYFDRPGNGG
jgi:hypothetical protein